MVSTLEQHQGGLEHHIDNKPTGPEGFVVNHGITQFKVFLN